ncbi:hypothetical protein LOAG_15296 [Loa loa]|uniref:C2H2-type domain-containing protein n=1 Tax=Loa loa TaxID=7209 RepID=A0A1S0TG69_LOALO|nr:hypothetical protein LOAG_15296 [Loa loa]EFO13233.1 hypothetical protein LOAG_15296 [Loa loa]
MAYIIWFNLLLCIASVQNIPVGQKYECRHCNTTMQTDKEYSKHLETHKKYNCTWPKCKKAYLRICDLQRHYKTHQFKYQCGCGNLFSRRDTLRIHQRRCDGSSR